MKLNPIIGASCLALVTLATTAKAFTYTPFITGSQMDVALGLPNDGYGFPIGLAYAGDKFVGSANYQYGNQLYQSTLDGSTVTKFGAAITNFGSTPGEIFVAASLGTGNYGNNDIYAGSENLGTVVKFAHNSTTSTTASVFVSGLDAGVRSIAFDPYGLYGNQMVVATRNGKIYTVNSLGQATLLANVHEDVEGLSFSNTTFGGRALGTLFVASEGSGWIRSINWNSGMNSFQATNEFQVASAESIHFVPQNIGPSNSVAGYYAVSYPALSSPADGIYKISADQFAGLGGDVLVTSEGGRTIFDIKYANGTYTGTGSGTYYPNQPEDSIFVTAEVIQQHNTPDGGVTVALLGSALLGLAALRRRCASA